MRKSSSEKLSYQQILHLFKETEKKLQKTDEILSEKFQETDRKIQKTDEILSEKFQETDRKFQETDRKFQETDRKFQETDKKLRKLESLFIGQWGKLIESLVNSNLTKLLIEWGIDITTTSQRVKSRYRNKDVEFDIIAHNGNDIVVVEVKTTLKVEHIKDFIEELKLFKKIFPEYKKKNVYGAVAFLVVEEEADKYAYKQGLFVIKATSESAKIINDKKFKPAKW